MKQITLAELLADPIQVVRVTCAGGKSFERHENGALIECGEPTYVVLASGDVIECSDASLKDIYDAFLEAEEATEDVIPINPATASDEELAPPPAGKIIPPLSEGSTDDTTGQEAPSEGGVTVAE